MLTRADRIRGRINRLDHQIDALHKKRDKLQDTLDAELLVENRQKFCCPCVMLNGDLGIYDNAHREATGRVSLMAGCLVAEALSAMKGCPTCAGTGTPTEPLVEDAVRAHKTLGRTVGLFTAAAPAAAIQPPRDP